MCLRRFLIQVRHATGTVLEIGATAIPATLDSPGGINQR